MSSYPEKTSYENHQSKTKDLFYSFEVLKQVDTNNTTLETLGEPNQASFGPSPDLLEAKIRQTKAEIDVIQNSPVSVIPESTPLHYDILQIELEKSVSELTDTLKFISAETLEMEVEIQEEDRLSNELGDLVVDSLQKRLEEQNFESDNAEGAKEKMNSEITGMKIKANAYFKQILKDLSQFCNKYFSLPSEQDFNDQQKKLRSADKTLTVRNMLSLKDIISELMNKCFDEPNQPYIVLDKRYWPPYVELLLRCQIVVRHPDDPRRIKLIPFHL